MLVVIPFTIISFLIMMKTLKSSIILSRKTYEKAGGVAEEILYKLKQFQVLLIFILKWKDLVL